MSFKKIFRNFKNFLLNNLFIFIYGQITILKKNNKNVEIQEIDKINNFDVRKYNYKFLKINKGRIFTNYVENVSVISNSQLIKDFSFNQISGKLDNSKNEVLLNGTPKVLKKYNGVVALLAQGASGHENFAHWLIDIIPKIKMINSKYSYKKIDFFYFSKLSDFQKQSLNIMGIKTNNFIDSKIYRHIEADTLLAVTHPNYFEGTFFHAQSNLPEWIVKYVRKIFLKDKIKKNIKFERIFIDRSDSKTNHCKFINNIQILEYFKKNKFKILQLSKLNFIDQVSIFNNAKIIVSPHGAGLANLIFCKKGTKIIEFKPKTNKNLLFKRISKINNLKHKIVYLESIKNDKKGDMFLNLKNVRRSSKSIF